MKFDEPLKVADDVAEVRKREAEKKMKLWGSNRIHKGHKLYEVNLKEQTIKEAKFEEQKASFEKEVAIGSRSGLLVASYKDGRKKVVLKSDKEIRKVVIRKDNCIYVPALNMKNLKKKLIKKGVIKIVKNEG